jgi:hypothetical protein
MKYAVLSCFLTVSLTIVQAFQLVLPGTISNRSPSFLVSSRITFGPTITTPATLISLGAGNIASDNTISFEWLPDSDTPIPFVDTQGDNFIDCYVDSIATINGVKYTVGSPCDHPVALCMYDDQDELVTIELDDEYMDQVFPVAENVIEEQFGEELVLVRTPQTLTLAGELDIDEEEDEEDDDEEEDEEEQVELLVTFEMDDGREIHLVRLLDPVSLVGKFDAQNPNRRLLLTPTESEEIMPLLEPLYKQKLDELQYQLDEED